MSTLETRCLDAFPSWLRSLADDARAFGELVGNAELSEGTRRRAAGALNYLFKSLDLIPDGIEDLGFIDDAFVFRVSAALALAEDGDAAAKDGTHSLTRLGADAALVSELLGGDYARLEAYVKNLEKGAVRGRSVDDIVADDAVRAELVRDTKGWADSYSAPSFARDEKNLVKLKSFLAAKLPA